MTIHNTAAANRATPLANIVAHFPHTATHVDNPDLRGIDGISLGRTKYDDERTRRTGHKRNRINGGRNRRATLQLPQINTLIATADSTRSATSSKK
jgi:hypothetical protein